MNFDSKVGLAEDNGRMLRNKPATSFTDYLLPAYYGFLLRQLATCKLPEIGTLNTGQVTCTPSQTKGMTKTKQILKEILEFHLDFHLAFHKRH